jgi:ABC-type dipeptide/oligopeptide/nickel transport system permease subunit
LPTCSQTSSTATSTQGSAIPETQPSPTPITAAAAGGGSVVAPGVEEVFEHGLEIKARSQWAYARRRFLRHRLAVGSLIVVVTIFLIGAFASVVAPYSYEDIDLENLHAPPTIEGKHFFGTDELGRDYLSRVIYGIRTSETVGLFVAGLSTLIGVLVGSLAGYYGGWIDNLLMRITDLVLTLPALAILLTFSALYGSGNKWRIGLILALFFWTALARIVRGTFLSLREKEYVEAAKAAGAGDLRIMMRHILPNAVGPIVVNATLVVGTAILVEAALAFLGLGIQPPTPALGALVFEGQDNPQAWWLTVFPGLTVVLIVLCVNFVGDGLRDALDPTQRRVRA